MVEHRQPFVLATIGVWVALELHFGRPVEVESGQRLVERDPYRLLRHPSYVGVLLLATGYGMITGVWPALLIGGDRTHGRAGAAHSGRGARADRDHGRYLPRL